MNPLLDSTQFMKLANIKSPTTLIKYERLGLIKVTMRIGNRKRYSMSEVKRFLGY